MLYVITLNWNGKDRLSKLYPTLTKALEDVDYKWLIKDNNSADGSIDLEKKWNNPNVIFFKYKNNLQNYSQGCNFLLNESQRKSDDLILLLNNDIEIGDEHSIKNMIDLISKDDSIGVVGAKLTYPNTKLMQHAGVIISNQYNNLPYHYRLNEKEDNAAKSNREFQAVTGALLLSKSKYIDKLDEKLIWCFDDIDLCFNIKYNLNKKIVYCGQTNIYHEESASLKKNPMNKLFITHNVSYFKQKWNERYSIDHQSYLDNSNYNLYK